jgi:excisionase family DNA binding protein
MEVTLVEAARYLKVSEKTVRRWVITNKVQGIQKPSPRGPQ